MRGEQLDGADEAMERGQHMLGFQTTKTAIALSAALTMTTMFVAPQARADGTGDAWQFRASLYGYFPDVGTNASLPTGPTSIDLEAGDLLEHTDAAFMGLIEGQHGRFGFFSDLMYFNIGNSVNDSTQISIGGGVPLPPGINFDGSLDVKLWTWTVAGVYRVIDGPQTQLDAFAGVRMLSIDTELKYAFNTDFGPFSGPARAGKAAASMENWDGIVGAKGSYRFGDEREWFVTGYADIGTGDSDLTWQVFAGVGRSFGRFDVTAGWRHLEYEFASDSRVEDLSFDGPVVGVSFRF